MPRENTAIAHVTDISLQLNFTSNLQRAFCGIYSITYAPYTTGLGGADGTYVNSYNQSGNATAGRAQDAEGANISYKIAPIKEYNLATYIYFDYEKIIYFLFLSII